MVKKKYVISLVAIVTVFIGYNALQAKKGNSVYGDLILANTEALAYYENGGYNFPWEWGDGLTKDEYSERRECQIQTYTSVSSGSASNVNVSFPANGGANISMGSSSGNSFTTATSTQSTGTKITCWDGGYENCTPVSCQ